MDITHFSQLLTPEVEAFLFGLVQFITTWLGSKFHKDASKVFALMCPIIAVIYISLTFKWSEPLAPQLAGKTLLVFTISTGIWKWHRDWSGKTEQSKQALIEHGKDLANAQNQGTVTVIPVQSESPVTVGEPVQVQTNPSPEPVYVPVQNDHPEASGDTLSQQSVRGSQQPDNQQP